MNQLEFVITTEETEALLKKLRRYGGTPVVDQNLKEEAAFVIEMLIDKLDEAYGRK